MPQPVLTRFAPSPTGFLHRGHAYSALLAYKFAQKMQGHFLLRIEDIDRQRCRETYIPPMIEDLKWLGIHWQGDIRRQSQHFPDYQKALNRLKDMGLVYPCVCSRREILDDDPAFGPEGVIYSGRCRGQDVDLSRPHVWRLDMQAATAYLKQHNILPRGWHDGVHGFQSLDVSQIGDVVLVRKDTPTSYHLSVVVDDALQAISHVIRGMDLFHATHIHCVLQALLDMPQPLYIHHPLMTNAEGKKFAKSERSETLQSIREAGVTAQDLIESLPPIDKLLDRLSF